MSIKLSDNWFVDLPKDWEKVIGFQSTLPYFKDMVDSLEKRMSANCTIAPTKDKIFNAFCSTPLSSVRVVIIGQDPYPDQKIATGLSFGVQRGCPIPRTLDNIINELETGMNEPEWDEETKKVVRPTYRFVDRTNMTLEGWAKQGVLLLNSCLTTEEGMSGAHQNIGWEQFTDQIVLSVKQSNKPIAYVLWGDKAHQKYKKICEGKGCGTNNSIVIASTHPGPLSFNRGPWNLRFMGSRPFSQVNRFFGSKGLPHIDWFKTGG